MSKRLQIIIDQIEKEMQTMLQLADSFHEGAAAHKAIDDFFDAAQQEVELERDMIAAAIEDAAKNGTH